MVTAVVLAKDVILVAIDAFLEGLKIEVSKIPPPTKANGMPSQETRNYERPGRQLTELILHSKNITRANSRSTKDAKELCIKMTKQKQCAYLELVVGFFRSFEAGAKPLLEVLTQAPQLRVITSQLNDRL